MSSTNDTTPNKNNSEHAAGTSSTPPRRILRARRLKSTEPSREQQREIFSNVSAAAAPPLDPNYDAEMAADSAKNSILTAPAKLKLEEGEEEEDVLRSLAKRAASLHNISGDHPGVLKAIDYAIAKRKESSFSRSTAAEATSSATAASTVPDGNFDVMAAIDVSLGQIMNADEDTPSAVLRQTALDAAAEFGVSRMDSDLCTAIDIAIQEKQVVASRKTTQAAGVGSAAGASGTSSPGDVSSPDTSGAASAFSPITAWKDIMVVSPSKEDGNKNDSTGESKKPADKPPHKEDTNEESKPAAKDANTSGGDSDGDEEERKPIAWDALSEVDSDEAEMNDVDPHYDDEIMDCDEDDYDDSHYDEEEDYDDEDYDDDDGNPFMDGEAQAMFHAFMHRMHAEMTGGSDDVGDDESNHCDCPRCTARRMMREEASNFCDCWECRRERGELDGSDDDGGSLSSSDSMPPLEDKNGQLVTEPKSKSSEDVSEAVDEDGPHCAICFTPFSSRNPKVLLPCCGKAEGECESTMVFCEKCIVKTVATKDKEEMENRYGPFAAYMMSKRANEAKLGECLRCRKLISVQKSPFSISMGTFDQAIRFAVERSDKPMRETLFVLAFAHYHYVPFELLGKDVTRVGKLCQLGVITAVEAEKLYKIHPINQPKLYKYMTLKSVRPDFEDSDGKTITNEDEWLSKAYSIIMMEYMQGAYMAVTSWRIRVALRLVHHAAIVNWKYFKILPKETAYELGVVVSGSVVLFNIIMLCLLVVVAVIAGFLAGTGVGLAKAFKWMVLTTFKPDGRKILGKIALALVLCLACRFCLGWGFWRFVGATLVVPLRKGAKLLQRKYKQFSLDLMNILIWVAYGWFMFESLTSPHVKDLSLIDSTLACATIFICAMEFTKAAESQVAT